MQETERMDCTFEDAMVFAGRVEKGVSFVREWRRQRESCLFPGEKQKQGSDYNTNALFGSPAVMSTPDLDPQLCAAIFQWVCLYRIGFEIILTFQHAPYNETRVPNAHQKQADSAAIIRFLLKAHKQSARLYTSPMRTVQNVRLQTSRGSHSWTAALYAVSS